MGNDGGSIPDRRDLVRNKPKAEQADKANQTRAKWFFCALSKRKLQEPVVSCALGKIYNKDSIIEYLLDKSIYGDGEKICGHIRSLKDVKQLTLTPNPAPPSTSTSGGPEGDPLDRAQFVCPLTMKEMNGAQPFVYISSCGCVFSQAGLRAVSGKEKEKSVTPPADEEKGEGEREAGEKAGEKKDDQLDLCPQCAKKYSKSEIIPLNPSPEETEILYLKMEKQRLLEPAKKKSSKKRKLADCSSSDPAAPPSKSKRLHTTQSNSHSNSPAPAQAPSLNPSMAASTRAVARSLKEEEEKRKKGMSQAVKSLYGDPTKRKVKETFMTMGTFTRYA